METVTQSTETFCPCVFLSSPFDCESFLKFRPLEYKNGRSPGCQKKNNSFISVVLPFLLIYQFKSINTQWLKKLQLSSTPYTTTSLN